MWEDATAGPQRQAKNRFFNSAPPGRGPGGPPAPATGRGLFFYGSSSKPISNAGSGPQKSAESLSPPPGRPPGAL